MSNVTNGRSDKALRQMVMMLDLVGQGVEKARALAFELETSLDLLDVPGAFQAEVQMVLLEGELQSLRNAVKFLNERYAAVEAEIGNRDA